MKFILSSVDGMGIKELNLVKYYSLLVKEGFKLERESNYYIIENLDVDKIIKLLNIVKKINDSFSLIIDRDYETKKLKIIIYDGYLEQENRNEF